MKLKINNSMVKIKYNGFMRGVGQSMMEYKSNKMLLHYIMHEYNSFLHYDNNNIMENIDDNTKFSVIFHNIKI